MNKQEKNELIEDFNRIIEDLNRNVKERLDTHKVVGWLPKLSESKDRVIIESPFRGRDKFEKERNINYAQSALEDSLMRGEAPISSHLLHTQVLDDNIPSERDMGIDAGLAWFDVADKVVFYIDHGMSCGMRNALYIALEASKTTNLEIEFRSI